MQLAWSAPDPFANLPKPEQYPDRIDMFVEEWIKTNNTTTAIMATLPELVQKDNHHIFSAIGSQWKRHPDVVLRMQQLRRQLELGDVERIVSKSELVAMLREVALSKSAPDHNGQQHYIYPETSRMKAAQQIADIMAMVPKVPNVDARTQTINQYGNPSGSIIVVPGPMPPQQLEQRTVYVNADGTPESN
jgi:hypothetical protein